MAQTPGPRILFAPASGPGVGGGHVMRDLTLATALRMQGAVCGFAAGEMGLAQIEWYGGFAWPVCLCDSDPQEILEKARLFQAEIVVLDNYALDATAGNRLRESGAMVVVVDDLADRAYACDLLIDPGYGRREADYATLVPDGCQLALGPDYALVRADIATLAKRPPQPLRETVERVFVSFGLSDVAAVTARAVWGLRKLAPEVEFVVAIARDTESTRPLQDLADSDPRVRVYVEARNIGELMQDADIAVGAGGSSTWERCAMGLPTLAAIVADNQAEVIGHMAEAGVLLAADLRHPRFDAQLAAQFTDLLKLGVRARLSAASRALCDGQGAARAARAILARLGAMKA